MYKRSQYVASQLAAIAAKSPASRRILKRCQPSECQSRSFAAERNAALRPACRAWRKAHDKPKPKPVIERKAWHGGKAMRAKTSTMSGTGPRSGGR